MQSSEFDGRLSDVQTQSGLRGRGAAGKRGHVAYRIASPSRFVTQLRQSATSDTAMRMIRFLTVGVLNTAIGLGLIWLLMAAGSNPTVANAVGFAVGMAVSFTLNRKWTFSHRGDWRASLPRWLAVAAVAYAANLAVMLGLSRGAGINPYLAQLTGVGTYTVMSYFGSKRFAFAAN